MGDSLPMNFDTIMDNPLLSGMVVTALGTIGIGLKKLWDEIIAALVRTLQEVAPDGTHEATNVDMRIVNKVRTRRDRSTVRNHVTSTLVAALPTGFIIEQAIQKRQRHSVLHPELEDL